MSGLRAKIDYVLKHNPFVYKLFFVFGSLFFRFIGLFIPIRKKRILFTAHSRLYNDSPKAIYEFLIRHTEYDEYELIWGLENPGKINIPGRAKKVQIDTFKYFCIALSSKYWVTCVNIERGLRFKKKNTVFLNTWHGFPVKGTGINDERKKEDYSHIDFFCIGGEFDKKYFADCFNIPETHFLHSGFPRMDELFNILPSESISIKNKLGIQLDKKIILYAPTWRDSKNNGVNYNINIPADFKKWETILGNDFILLMRLHPYTNEVLKIDYNDFIRDYSSYPNINDLLKISDILISDYSGTFIEFSALRKPMICFAYDLDDYKRERGLGMDIEHEIPGGVMKTEEMVLKRILTMDYQAESVLSEAFCKKYITSKYIGNSTDFCVSKLLGKN